MTSLSFVGLKARWTLQKLRPPSRKKLFLLESFSFESTLNLGHAYRLEVDEPVVAAGDGTVSSIRLLFPAWKFTPGDPVGSNTTYEIIIDHGNDISTVVHGILTHQVKVGQPVTRGDLIGVPLSREVFFQIRWQGQSYDPSTASRHFRVQDGQRAIGRTGYVREAPDMLAHNFFNAVRLVLYNGIHYFVNILGSKPDFLVNIDFNGTGTYTGQAFIGTPGDYWNAYVPVVFTEDSRDCYCVAPSYAYGSCFTYSTPAVVNLKNNHASDIGTWLEKIAPITGSSGTTPTWDTMLSTWIGGFSGGIPVQTTFKLHSLPPGTYELYLYSDQTDAGFGSDYYAQIDSGPIFHKATSPSGAVTWLQDDNYVVFTNLVIVPGSILQVEVLGFLAGLQIRRT
jgi:hypothetical protein